MVKITGNTYPVKEKIKALGGKWDVDCKAWLVPDDKAEEAKRLVSCAPRDYSGPKKCIVCGRVERRDRRGYPIGDPVYRNGECRSCYEERKMGY